MPKNSILVLRVGLGLTFLVIGVLIWREPELWGAFIQPWAQDLLIGSVENTMRTTAVLDMVIGLALIIGFYTWLAAAIAVLHLLLVIITVGFNDTTVRDFGLLTASLALFLATLPKQFQRQ